MNGDPLISKGRKQLYFILALSMCMCTLIGCGSASDTDGTAAVDFNTKAADSHGVTSNQPDGTVDDSLFHGIAIETEELVSAESALSEAVETQEATTADPDGRTRDHTPPVITGAKDLYAETGGVVSYKSGVSVTDDLDRAPKLTVDSSKADLSKSGAYYITYIASDWNGNTSEETVMLFVNEPVKEGEDVDKLMTYARAAVDECVSDDMSDVDKLYAIFWYVKNTLKYTGEADKTSYIQEGIKAFSVRNGDCFTYFSMLKAMMEAAGFETVDIVREGGPTQHFWSMVKYEGSWYHIDACPRPEEHGKRWYCFLRTDAQLEKFNSDWGEGYYYVHDMTNCPKTPEEALENEYKINGEGYAGYE